MTATIYELLERGLDRIYSDSDRVIGVNQNEHGMITSIEDPDYLQKIINYDSEVQEVVEKIFSFSFTNKSFDAYIKKIIIQRFMDRSIKWEFVPVSAFVWAPKIFTMKLASACAQKDKFLSFTYENYEKYLVAGTHSISDDEAHTINESNNRNILATLPQTKYNLNVRDYISPTASENRVDNGLSDTSHTDHKEDTTDNFNPTQLLQMENIFKDFVEELDGLLFKQVWGNRINEQNY